MRPSTVNMVATAMMILAAFSEIGCSWIAWQKVPEKGAPAEYVECRLKPHIIDSVMTAGSLAGMGVFYGLSAVHQCSEDSGCIFDEGQFYSWIGIGFTVIAAVWGIASISGWVNYHNCREYQERVSLDKQLHTNQELFKPEAPNPPP
jgi:hypothetical protein